jgi:hypothetical protein
LDLIHPLAVAGYLFSPTSAGCNAAMNPTKQELSAAAPELGLDAARVDSLSSKVAAAEFPATRVACLVAQMVLGQSQVDTTPLNGSNVEQNW